MIEYIEGKITTRTPTFIVIDIGGIAYRINISLNTYNAIANEESCKLLIHLAIKEDSHTLYGFSNDEERTLFRNLISVSGIGTNTAILVLSSLQTKEVINAIISANVPLLKSIKGIGPKTAQRIVIELQDSFTKKGSETVIPSIVANITVEESINALVMLGFKKGEAEKAVMKVINESAEEINTEEIIKLSLKIL